MSKKKNTLQDLDNFLKQQAATLVKPETLSDTVDTVQESEAQVVEKTTATAGEFQTGISKHDPSFRNKLYDFIIESLESQHESLPEDKMLINTALYLKGGSDWKNTIRQYWRGK